MVTQLNLIGTNANRTVSYGHGITTTPLQAATVYGILSNGGYMIKPKLSNNEEKTLRERIISEKTSRDINNILRKVVTDDNGTAHLADKEGYNVGGKTGTSQNYKNKNESLNTFISVFPTQKPKYVLLVMLENPQVPENLFITTSVKLKLFEMRLMELVYVAGKIMKIGPILAIKSKDFNADLYVAEKLIKNIPSKIKFTNKRLSSNSKKIKKGFIFFVLLKQF